MFQEELVPSHPKLSCQFRSARVLNDKAFPTTDRAFYCLLEFNIAVLERVVVLFTFPMERLLHLSYIHTRHNVPTNMISWI